MQRQVVYQTKKSIGIMSIDDFNVKQPPAIRTHIAYVSEELINNLQYCYRTSKKLYADLLIDILDQDPMIVCSQ